MGYGDEERTQSSGKTQKQGEGRQWLVLHPSGKEHMHQRKLCFGLPSPVSLRYTLGVAGDSEPWRMRR